MKHARPGPLRWLWYALGGRLPVRYQDWVLHDASCRTWMLRHFARASVQMSLVVIPILFLVPGPLWVRLVSVLLGWLVAMRCALFIMEPSVERRVQKAGHPPGAAQAARDARRAVERAAEQARYIATYRRPAT